MCCCICCLIKIGLLLGLFEYIKNVVFFVNGITPPCRSLFDSVNEYDQGLHKFNPRSIDMKTNLY